MGIAQLAQDRTVVMGLFAHLGKIEHAFPGTAMPGGIVLNCGLFLLRERRKPVVTFCAHRISLPQLRPR